MFESKDLDYHKGKYYGLYRAYVYDNKDPKNMGRLKLQIPNVYGVDGTEMLVTDWAYPIFPTCGNRSGLIAIPPTENIDGSRVLVWVAFEMGDKNKPVWLGGPISSNGLPDDVLSNQKHKINGNTDASVYEFITPRGHKIVLNDETNEVILSTSGGQKIKMNDENGINIISYIDINITCGDNNINVNNNNIIINDQIF